MTERIDRRRFLGRGVRLSLGAVSAALLPSLAACSSHPTRVCGLGCAGDADVLAQQLGTSIQYERIYHQIESFPGPQEAAAWGAGRVPVSSFKTLDSTGAPIPFASVAAGSADAQLDALARSLDTGLTGEMVLIYFHEPEAEAGEGRADFASAFRRVRSRIEGGLSPAAQGRIRWAMCLTYSYYADGSVDEFYPGDDVIDVLAADGYSWCPGSGHGANAISFRKLFAATEGFARAHDKPWMVTEVGTWNDPAPGRSKADWIEEAVPVVGGWPSLEAVLWFEHNAGFRCDWTLGSDEAALAAFRHMGERMCARA